MIFVSSLESVSGNNREEGNLACRRLQRHLVWSGGAGAHDAAVVLLQSQRHSLIECDAG
jgi:hypothetical protein